MLSHNNQFLQEFVKSVSASPLNDLVGSVVIRNKISKDLQVGSEPQDLHGILDLDNSWKAFIFEIDYDGFMNSMHAMKLNFIFREFIYSVNAMNAKS